MIECILFCMIFLAGAFFAIFAMTNQWILASVVAICGFIIMIGLIRNWNPKNHEIILKKLTYLYVLMNIVPNMEGNAIMKSIKRVLKELALDTCGVGCLSIWIKYEAEHRKLMEKIIKENNKDGE